MNHELFGELCYGRGSEEWTGSVVLRRFATFALARYDGDLEQQSRRSGILPLTIIDPTGVGPSPQQVAAFKFIRDHEDEVFQAVLIALFKSYKDYTTSILSPVWDWIGRRLGVKPIESPEGLEAAASFMSVEIVRESRYDFAYTLFHVDCDWEPEHGMMIVYHKDVPATWTTADAIELESDEDE